MGQQYNAVSHGLYAKEALLPFENRRQYLRFCRELVNSLSPENEIQSHLARDIAEDAWKIARIDRTINAMQEEIFGRLTPEMVCEVANVLSSVRSAAPSWLVDMNHKISRKEKQLHARVCSQYEHVTVTLPACLIWSLFISNTPICFCWPINLHSKRAREPFLIRRLIPSIQYGSKAPRHCGKC